MRKEIQTLHELAMQLPHEEGKRGVVYIIRTLAESKTRKPEEEIVGSLLAMWDLLMLLSNSKVKMDLASRMGAILFAETA